MSTAVVWARHPAGGQGTPNHSGQTAVLGEVRADHKSKALSRGMDWAYWAGPVYNIHHGQPQKKRKWRMPLPCLAQVECGETLFIRPDKVQCDLQIFFSPLFSTTSGGMRSVVVPW